jgi:hypothetical protein
MCQHPILALIKHVAGCAWPKYLLWGSNTVVAGRFQIPASRNTKFCRGPAILTSFLVFSLLKLGEIRAVHEASKGALPLRNQGSCRSARNRCHHVIAKRVSGYGQHTWKKFPLIVLPQMPSSKSADQPHASTRSRSPSDAAAPSHSSLEKKRTRDRQEDTRLESRIAALNESNPWHLEVHGLIESPLIRPLGCLLEIILFYMVSGYSDR